MKKLFICALLALAAMPALAAGGKDEELSFEGKVSAQIIRHVSVPFPIIVDRVLVGIGEDVKKDQRLLEYHLEDRVERGLQNELLTAGGQADFRSQKSALEQELLASGSKRRLSSELAAKGLGSQEESAINARSHGLVQNRLQALNQKERAAQSDFAYRLRELEKDLGHKLKAGQKLPRELYMTSPIDATVISMSPQARPMGELNGAAFTLAILNPIQVQIQVHESEITRLRVGQAATVELASDEKLRLPGKITMLSWQPNDASIAVPSFYFVWVDVENPDHVLKPGYKVMVHVESGS